MAEVLANVTVGYIIAHLMCTCSESVSLWSFTDVELSYCWCNIVIVGNYVV